MGPDSWLQNMKLRTQLALGVVLAAGALFIVGCNNEAEGGSNADMIAEQQKKLPPVDPNVVPKAPQREDGGGAPKPVGMKKLPGG